MNSISFKNEITIAGKTISVAHRPYIVAELSANHNGSFERVKKLMSEAKNIGVDAVKIQTYDPDIITLNSNLPEFTIKGGLWNGRRLYDLYKEAHLPWAWHGPLFNYANSLNLTMFSSPFDNTAVDLLEQLGAPAYKISSFELVDINLIRRVARTGKPIIMSTGIASDEEINEALTAAYHAGAQQIVLLHCVSKYPATATEYNLHKMNYMFKRFNVLVGLSDHTINNAIAIASVAMGASIIEKHFTLNRLDSGPDDSFSLEPDDLKTLCQDVRIVHAALRKNAYHQKTINESKNIQFCRSLYFVNDLEAGAIITYKDIRSIRPGFGIKPKYWDKIIGARTSIAIKAPKAVSWDDLY